MVAGGAITAVGNGTGATEMGANPVADRTDAATEGTADADTEVAGTSIAREIGGPVADGIGKPV